MTQLTPMMQQYFQLKEQNPGCILFFRMGDFYEMFGEDAKVGARELQIALTARNRGEGEKIPMAGVPVKAAQNYISRLIQKGYRVAIGEQIEDPKESKGLVARDVVQIITPGTITDGEILGDNNNYLASLVLERETYGLAYMDISTGDFRTTQLKEGILRDEILRIKPAEILIPEEICLGELLNRTLLDENIPLEKVEGVRKEKAISFLNYFFKTNSLQGFGLSQKYLSCQAAAMILLYLEKTQKTSLGHITGISSYSTSRYMELDQTTRRNLELTETLRDKKKEGSLLWVLDKTMTSMGGRALRQFLEQPLLDVLEINRRLSIIKEMHHQPLMVARIKEHLKHIYDLPRLMGRISLGRANARDLISLQMSLARLPFIKDDLLGAEGQSLNQLGQKLMILTPVVDLIQRGIREDPPATITEGHIINDAFNQELDELRKITQGGREWIANLEREEKEKTGIGSLKVRYNKVFGYYLEVTNSNLHLVPENYQRKQTLSNSERFITPQLKEKEDQILRAQEKMMHLEYQLFTQIREEICTYTYEIQESSKILAYLDVMQSLAIVAQENNYCQPIFHTKDEIIIKTGRHPVIEKTLTNDDFIPNDTKLEENKNHFHIITGPNMSGKSTYMRQVALIILMAQLGSFVPARRASLRITDRIFTRVGASDDLATNQSTFMVEMNEVANILHNSTAQSLILLDEVGRGTATFDGLSIAWAITEYLVEKKGGMTLFATHYHELTELASRIKGIKNYRVAVKEKEGEILFLHQIVPGTSDESYGIEVAKLAGIPKEIIQRSQEILMNLKKEKKVPQIQHISEPRTKEPQLSLFKGDKRILEELMKMDIHHMTPMEAINQLYQLKKLAEKEDDFCG